MLFKDLFKGVTAAAGVRMPTLMMPNWLVLSVAALDTLRARLTKTAPTMPLEGVRTLLPKRTVSSAKAERELGATFRPIIDTLCDTVQWYAENGYIKRTSKA